VRRSASCPAPRFAERSQIAGQGARGGAAQSTDPLWSNTQFSSLCLLKPAADAFAPWCLVADQKVCLNFRKSPPPGMVTIPCRCKRPRLGPDTMAGYPQRRQSCDPHRYGLERLQICSVRGFARGFEAKADMLSISRHHAGGSFADLMKGLAITPKAGERPKVKAVTAVLCPNASKDIPAE